MGHTDRQTDTHTHSHAFQSLRLVWGEVGHTHTHTSESYGLTGGGRCDSTGAAFLLFMLIVRPLDFISSGEDSKVH